MQTIFFAVIFHSSKKCLFGICFEIMESVNVTELSILFIFVLLTLNPTGVSGS